MTNVSDKSYRENQNTYFMFNDFFFKENNGIYEMMLEHMVETDRPQMTVQYGTSTFHAGHRDTQLEHEIRIGFPL